MNTSPILLSGDANLTKQGDKFVIRMPTHDGYTDQVLTLEQLESLYEAYEKLVSKLGRKRANQLFGSTLKK